MSEFKELEFETFDLNDEGEEARMKAVLKKMNGVHTARITRNGVHIIYNSRGIAPDEIAHALRQAGFTIAYSQLV